MQGLNDIRSGLYREIFPDNKKGAMTLEEEHEAYYQQ